MLKMAKDISFVVINMNKELEIYKYLLKYHKGKENKVKAKDLMKIFNILDHKTFRKLIQNINRDKQFKKLIGAISSRDGGYYICETKEETLDAINNRKHRANQMLRECHIMDWKYRKFKDGD